jgi:predicted XRE-type DNA-binding protein
MPRNKRSLSSVTKGSIFHDRDLFTAEEGAKLEIKSVLLDAIYSELQRNRYTQAQLGKVLGEYQPNISNLLQGRISQFSIDKLVYYVTRLGLKTEMRVNTQPGLARRKTARSSRRRNGRAAA